jgi:small subunit ribosomal protein S17
METTTTTSRKRKLQGTVVSDKMDKTIVVKVDRFIKHPKYGKFYTISQKYKAHVDGDKPTIGTTVTIEESRPISKTKSFKLVA